MFKADKSVVCVSAGLDAPKKNDSIVKRRAMYLNYGLLSLANSEQVPDGGVIHGHFERPETIVGEVRSIASRTRIAGFFLSCPSFLSLDWLRRFSALIRDDFPDCFQLLGGRWVVDSLGSSPPAQIATVDALHLGLGEPGIAEAVARVGGSNFFRRTSAATRVFEQTGLSSLDYTKLLKSDHFVPSFEVSRGCGAGCHFCAEADVKLTSLKPPRLLANEIAVGLLSRTDDIRRCYLEASSFVPRIDWITSFAGAREEAGISDVVWRTECRADLLPAGRVEELAKVGLRVLDIGLESASHSQLRRMNKTRSPARYLEKCERVIREATSCGVQTKLNVLLFPGETRTTITETLSWLMDRKAHIDAVSVGPTILYGFDPQTRALLEYFRSLGADVAYERVPGMRYLHLSPEVSFEESMGWCNVISRALMTDEEYYSVKSFSYFSPTYSRSDFLLDIDRQPDPEVHPFRMTTSAQST